MNLVHVEDSLATQLGDHAKRFMRIGKRFIVNMSYIYKVDIAKQELVLTDYGNLVFQLPISKDALKTVKDLVVRSKI